MFVDGSDALIEQAVGGTSVAEIFKLHGEGLFRDNEVSEVQFICYRFFEF